MYFHHLQDIFKTTRSGHVAEGKTSSKQDKHHLAVRLVFGHLKTMRKELLDPSLLGNYFFFVFPFITKGKKVIIVK